jgi:hypothetical protein
MALLVPRFARYARFLMTEEMDLARRLTSLSPPSDGKSLLPPGEPGFPDVAGAGTVTEMPLTPLEARD